MIVTTNAISPPPHSSAPRTSKRGLAGSEDSGTNASVARSMRSASGGLTQKIACQLKCSSRSPPTIGPSATPTPATAAQIPTACARSCGLGKTCTRMLSVDGMMQAPPRPISARQRVNTNTSCANTAVSEATMKIPRPITSSRRRPNRSPIAPASRRLPAKMTE